MCCRCACLYFAEVRSRAATCLFFPQSVPPMHRVIFTFQQIPSRVHKKVTNLTDAYAPTYTLHVHVCMQGVLRVKVLVLVLRRVVTIRKTQNNRNTTARLNTTQYPFNRNLGIRNRGHICVLFRSLCWNGNKFTVVHTHFWFVVTKLAHFILASAVKVTELSVAQTCSWILRSPLSKHELPSCWGDFFNPD